MKEFKIDEAKISGYDMPKGELEQRVNFPGYEQATELMEKRIAELESEKAVLEVALKNAEIDLEVQKSIKSDQIKEANKHFWDIQIKIYKIDEEMQELQKSINGASKDWELNN